MQTAQGAFEALERLMARLRAPDGCPWDREQHFDSLKPYLIEEAFEVLESIDGPRPQLREELGDLLFQVVFLSRLAEEEGSFGLAEVADGITRKMIRRHPHVFGEDPGATVDSRPAPAALSSGESSGSHLANWEQNKRNERRRSSSSASILDGIPAALPALLAAARLTDKASRVGFDWPEVSGVRLKLTEEIQELDEAIEEADPAHIEHELGDLLFTVVNLSRFLKVNPEEALRRANLRFKKRFQHIEKRLAAQGLSPEDVGLERLEQLWVEAKRAGEEG